MRTARKRQAEGFSLVEVIAAMTVFAIAGGAVAAGLIAASDQVGSVTRKSIANNIAQAELERARALPYLRIGTVGANPAGNLVPTESLTREGVVYTIKRSVVYVDDQSVATYQVRNYSNRKRIEVTVTRPGNFKAVKVTAFVSPPNFDTIAGRATIIATARDLLTGNPLSGVRVNVGNVAWNVAESDTTASPNGIATFAGLRPNSIGNPSVSTYNYTTSWTLPGYEVSAATKQTSANVLKVHLVRDTAPSVSARLFVPQIMNVTVKDDANANVLPGPVNLTVDHGTLTPVLGVLPYTLTNPSTSISVAPGGVPYPLEPTSSLKLNATAGDQCHEPASQVLGTLPSTIASYPGTVSSNFTLTLPRYPTLKILVLDNTQGGSVPAGTNVTLSGEGTVSTDSSGYATFTCVTPGTHTLSLPAATDWKYNLPPASQSVVALGVGSNPFLQNLSVGLDRENLFDCVQGSQARVTPRLRDQSGNVLSAPTFTLPAGSTAGANGAWCVNAGSNVLIKAAKTGYLPTEAQAYFPVTAGTSPTVALGVRQTSGTCTFNLTGGNSNTVGAMVRVTPEPTPLLSQLPIQVTLNAANQASVPNLVPGATYRITLTRPGRSARDNGIRTCTATTVAVTGLLGN